MLELVFLLLAAVAVVALVSVVLVVFLGTLALWIAARAGALPPVPVADPHPSPEQQAHALSHPGVSPHVPEVGVLGPLEASQSAANAPAYLDPTHRPKKRSCAPCEALRGKVVRLVRKVAKVTE